MTGDLEYARFIGVPSFDCARYSAPPSDIQQFETFSSGLCVIEYPRMEHVQTVLAPGEGGDVLIHFSESIARLDRTIAPEMRANAIRVRSLVVIPEGLATEWSAETGQPLCYHLHVPRVLREEWADDLGSGRVLPLVNRSTPEIDRLFAQIASELRGSDTFRRLKLQGLTLAAAAACFRLAMRDGARAPSSSRSMTPSRLRRVRTYVEDNLADEVCLEDMAACVGLSPAHFSRAFRAEMGVSPYAWVVQVRVERVKAEMLGTRKPLAEIALACGFASQSHMTETFRRATGMPPARWRLERMA